jgi:hypothetical protein
MPRQLMEAARLQAFREWARLGSNQRPLACEARRLLGLVTAGKPLVERNRPHLEGSACSPDSRRLPAITLDSGTTTRLVPIRCSAPASPSGARGFDVLHDPVHRVLELISEAELEDLVPAKSTGVCGRAPRSRRFCL